MDYKYSIEPIESEDLCTFGNKALECLRSSQNKDFEKSIKLIALCQGGGLHYAVTHGYATKYFEHQKNGLKDIDIWFFFKKESGKKDYPPQDILCCDFGPSKFGRDPDEEEEYIGRRMDIIGRSISFCDCHTDTPDVAVKRWLELGWNRSGKYYQNYIDRYGKEPSSYKLAEKAVVVIYPDKFFEKVLWVNPNLKSKN
jgi:hypothetical protein